MDRFERSRKKALGSSDPEVVEAASQYGAPGEAGVTVTPDFARDLNGANADIAPQWPTGDLRMRFRPGNTELERTVVHEGVHAVQIRAYLNSVDPVFGGRNQWLNLTVGMAELDAFRVGAKVTPYPFGGPNDAGRIVRHLATTPPYSRDYFNRIVGDPRWIR